MGESSDNDIIWICIIWLIWNLQNWAAAAAGRKPVLKTHEAVPHSFPKELHEAS